MPYTYKSLWCLFFSSSSMASSLSCWGLFSLTVAEVFFALILLKFTALVLLFWNYNSRVERSWAKVGPISRFPRAQLLNVSWRRSWAKVGYRETPY
ncbi:hypothetical protein HYPSUDRAFT_1041967 [Hypholoma sublateritium FD-334 SS-4]|uniref:Uncharacterized protein n=1 Tax=Hypholoma sublateritium (strain FD-334 SS-4) TaxID=945553 RepID=A0A0D2M280_HYPSF|nr:hypothetical protein HYPSUDRAFT_1041967 [Hypholoma sublateritium FD-334 SS-4]